MRPVVQKDILHNSYGIKFTYPLSQLIILCRSVAFIIIKTLFKNEFSSNHERRMSKDRADQHHNLQFFRIIFQAPGHILLTESPRLASGQHILRVLPHIVHLFLESVRHADIISIHSGNKFSTTQLQSFVQIFG